MYARRLVQPVGALGRRGIATPHSRGWMGLAIVRPGECVVRTRLGAITGVSGPGPTVYVPFLQRLTCISTTEVQQKVVTTVRLADGLFIDLDMFMRVRLMNLEMTTLHRYVTMHANPIDFLITAAKESVTKLAATIKDDQHLRNSVAATMATVRADLAPMAERFGLEVVDVRVDDIVLPKDVIEASDRAIAGERNRETEKQATQADAFNQLRKAEVAAQSAVMRATAMRDARKVIAEGLAESARDMGVDQDRALAVLLDFAKVEALAAAYANAKGITVITGGDGMTLGQHAMIPK